MRIDKKTENIFYTYLDACMHQETCHSADDNEKRRSGPLKKIVFCTVSEPTFFRPGARLLLSSFPGSPPTAPGTRFTNANEIKAGSPGACVLRLLCQIENTDELLIRRDARVMCVLHLHCCLNIHAAVSYESCGLIKNFGSI